MDKIEELLQKTERMPAGKKIKYIVIAVIIAVILALYFSTTGGTSSSPASVSADTAYVESRLEKVLSQVDGAGDVSVVITYESSNVLVPAMSEDSKETFDSASGNTTRSDKKEIVKTGGSDALILQENLPKVRGVVVVADGAGDIGVRMRLLNAVRTALDISSDKIEVLKKEDRDE